MTVPLIFVKTPDHLIPQESRGALAADLVTIGLDVERLPDTPTVRATAWVYFHGYPEGLVFTGDATEPADVITVEVNAFQGGLSEAAKRELVSRFTDAVRNAVATVSGTVASVYVIVRDIPAMNWGVNGNIISLEDIRSANT